MGIPCTQGAKPTRNPPQREADSQGKEGVAKGDVQKTVRGREQLGVSALGDHQVRTCANFRTQEQLQGARKLRSSGNALGGRLTPAIFTEVHPRNSQYQFAAIEGLGIATGRNTLHSSQAHQSEKRFRLKPAF